MNTRYASEPIIYKGDVAPGDTSDIPATLNDLWVDTSTTPATLKICTSTAPFVWDAVNNAVVEGIRSVSITIDGGTTTPTTGIHVRWSVPTACTVTGWVLVADASGSAVIDVLRSDYATFPVTVSIAGTDKPTLSTVQKNENLGPLTNWGSTALAAGDIVEFNLASVTTCTVLSLTLNITVP